jgi:hypothetical protein
MSHISYAEAGEQRQGGCSHQLNVATACPCVNRQVCQAGHVPGYALQANHVNQVASGM